MRKQIAEWRRLHAIEPAVTLRVITSPLDGWIVSIEGWTAPAHFGRTYPDIEAAQRAADGRAQHTIRGERDLAQTHADRIEESVVNSYGEVARNDNHPLRVSLGVLRTRMLCRLFENCSGKL
jgi:hypothetical protein